MTTQKATREGLIRKINYTISEYIDIVELLGNDKINQIPYEKSWTAAQLCNHVIKSALGFARAIKSAGTPTDMNSEEKIAELKAIFLDTSNKFESPEQIAPESGPFERQKVIDDLTQCVKDLDFNSQNTNLSEEINGGPLGMITKYESLHFVLYHSQRHLGQLKRIYDAIAK